MPDELWLIFSRGYYVGSPHKTEAGDKKYICADTAQQNMDILGEKLKDAHRYINELEKRLRSEEHTSELQSH